MLETVAYVVFILLVLMVFVFVSWDITKHINKHKAKKRTDSNRYKFWLG